MSSPWWMTLTTADVCYEIVRPATEGRRCPYCELAEAGEMGTAQAFVSHAWRYPFELLVSALEEAAMPPETFFWVDIAVVNQHTNATRGFDWWSGTFRMAVKHIGLTLLVLAPWRKAVTLERAWCIWEVRPVACLSRGPPPHLQGALEKHEPACYVVCRDAAQAALLELHAQTVLVLARSSKAG